MRTYKCLVRVPTGSGSVLMSIWTRVTALNAIQARQLLDAQYGKGNVLGTPVQV